MAVDPVNASELAEIGGEIGADVLEGALRYPSDTGSWQVGDVDLGEYLDCYRDQQVMVIIAPVQCADGCTHRIVIHAAIAGVRDAKASTANA